MIEKKGSNSGHPKRLLLVSEPKIQSHHEKRKAGCPCSLFHPGIQVPSSRYLLEEKGRGTIGHPFLPSSLERESTQGENGEWSLWP